MINSLVENPISFVIFIISIAFSLAWHEAAHALVAKWLGDDTADDLGRLTLNPIAHIDPLGALALLFIGFGWGKPVPVNPRNFRQPKLDNLKVALAGPISNLILACIFAIMLAIFHPDPQSIAAVLSTEMIMLNLTLMIFNLIPIPPLDGSKIVHLFLGEEAFLNFERYGYYVLLGLVFLSLAGIPILGQIIDAPVGFLSNLLIGR